MPPGVFVGKLGLSFLGPNMSVTSIEIGEIINDLSYNKSPGLDGITSEHIKVASQQLPISLSILMSAILIHGYVPRSKLTSVIVPIIKDKNNVRRITIDLYAYQMYLPKLLKNLCIVVWRIVCKLHLTNFGLNLRMVQICMFLS